MTSWTDTSPLSRGSPRLSQYVKLHTRQFVCRVIADVLVGTGMHIFHKVLVTDNPLEHISGPLKYYVTLFSGNCPPITPHNANRVR